jgi:hypothetical protein
MHVMENGAWVTTPDNEVSIVQVVARAAHCGNRCFTP